MNEEKFVKEKIRILDKEIINSNVLTKIKFLKISDFIGEKQKNKTKPDWNIIPTNPGVYFIVKFDKNIKFKTTSDADFAKGKEYKNLDRLYEEYNKGDKTIIYIGKADGKNGIRQRLKQYFRKYKSHSGGRLIWQIENNENLRVCWIELNDIKWNENAEEFEKKLLKKYNKEYNSNSINESELIVRPIANWRF